MSHGSEQAGRTQLQQPRPREGPPLPAAGGALATPTLPEHPDKTPALQVKQGSGLLRLFQLQRPCLCQRGLPPAWPMTTQICWQQLSTGCLQPGTPGHLEAVASSWGWLLAMGRRRRQDDPVRTPLCLGPSERSLEVAVWAVPSPPRRLATQCGQS